MNLNHKKALVILSGGQDSTTCLFWAKQYHDEVHALTFNYGQRHVREIESARKVAEMAEVASHEVLALGPEILKSTSPLIDKRAEVETYADADSLPGGIENTFVPGRNILFLTLAANRAVALDCGFIVIGVSEEDSGGYPDCRYDFIQTMQLALNRGLFGTDLKPLNIAAPLIELSKRTAVQMAMAMPGCMEALAYSHTCYKGEVPPCGQCHACLLRAKGFEEASILDPLIVRLAAETYDNDAESRGHCQ